MIEHITVTPENEDFAIDLHGELGQILGLVAKNEEAANTQRVSGSSSVVAGVGFEPTTFRL